MIKTDRGKYKKVKNSKNIMGYLFCFILILGLSWKLPVKAEVTQEELAGPVVDESTHLPQGGPRIHVSNYQYIYFGTYPQREITGVEITEEIKNASYNSKGEAEVNGKKYRRIDYKMTLVSGTINESKEKRERWKEKSNNGYRYFLYEPIKWRILSNQDGELMLLSEVLLDSQFVDSTWSALKNDPWASCRLRKWLNDDEKQQIDLGELYKNPGFLCSAFTKEEQERILVTHLQQVDNPEFGTDGGCDTDDKIYLLSYADTDNLAYGFCGKPESNGYRCTPLSGFPSQYAYAIEGEEFDPEHKLDGYGYWLRTPGDAYNSMMVCYGGGGVQYNGLYCNQLKTYVRPVINIKCSLSDFVRVHFEMENEKVIEDQIFYGSNIVAEPEIPTMEGYTFAGWYLDKDLTIPYHFNIRETKDTTLYAKWKPYVKVFFEVNGGNEINPQVLVQQEMVKKPVDPVRQGYIFTGWYKDENCTVPFDFTKGVNENITLYAGWLLDKGETFKEKNVQYKIISPSGKTIEYCGILDKSAKTKQQISIPATVTFDGITYKVTAVGKGACKNYKKLKKVVIGKNVTEIADDAFYGCNKLVSVKFSGTNLTKIGKNAFRKCVSLKTVTIPKSIKEIKKNAFRDCKKLKTIIVKTTKLTSKKVGSYAFKNISNKAVFKLPKKKYTAYKKIFTNKKIGYKKGMRLKKN